MGAWRAFFHPRSTARELAVAQAELIELAESDARHARRAQSLSEQTDALNEEMEMMRNELERTKLSLETLGAELMQCRRMLDMSRKDFAQANASLEMMRRDEAETDAKISQLVEMMGRAEQMKANYQSRISKLNAEVKRLRELLPDAADTEWFSPLTDL